MSKKSLSVLLFMFFVVLSFLSYLTLFLFCQNSINTSKTQLIATDKLLNTQFKEITQTNDKNANYLVNNYSFVSMLKDLESSYKTKNIDNYQKNLSGLNAFLTGLLSDEVNFISFYSTAGDMLASVSKVNTESPVVSLSNLIQRAINGENFNSMVQHNKQLYSVNIQPVNLNNKNYGVILLGREINNTILSSIPDVYNTQTIILTKNHVITSNLNQQDAQNILKLYKYDNSKLNKAITKSIPGVKPFIELKKIGNKNFWITGGSIINDYSAYLLLRDSNWWVDGYLFISNHLAYVLIFGFLGLIVLSILSGLAVEYFCNTLTQCSAKGIEKAKAVNESVNNNIDSFIDRMLASVLSFSNSGIFRNNNELMEISNSVTNMVKLYKTRIENDKTTSENNMTNPALRNESFVVSKTSTMYFSNIRNFIKLVDAKDPEFGFRILNIYLKLQHEIIPKYNGKIVNVSDDRVVAVFENNNAAENAVKAAIEIQNNIGKLNQINPEKVELSVSVVTGEVLAASVLDELYYTGTLLKIGSTIVNKTPSGWIYLDQDTYELRGFEEINSEEDFISIKGIKQHISFYKVSPEMINSAAIKLEKEQLNVIVN